MQVLLMDATGKPFPELMQSLVLKPLGMGKSIYQQPLSAKLNADTALAHENKGRRFNVPWKVYPALAATGLWSTPTDLALLVNSLQKTQSWPRHQAVHQGLRKRAFKSCRHRMF